jgi:NAD(P)-dependent dehydrogenase (short-subunit alcohol dehydrogenase family)
LRNEDFVFLYIGRTAPKQKWIANGDQFVEFDLGQAASPSLLKLVFQETQKILQAGAVFSGILYAAGALGPLGNKWESETRESNIAEENQAYFVNVLSFANLCRTLRTFLIESKIENVVFHLSSGAALNPYGEMAVYSSSKAAALMFAQCFAKDISFAQNEQGNTCVLSIAPGTVKTDMTQILAESDERRFPQLQKFRDLKTSNGFRPAQEVAGELARVIFDKKFKELRLNSCGKYLDLRQAAV